ncbi:MAG: sulfide/dihydroorotate dehydrogenase-like FAD/NAD-binding protein [Elusimicrobia bacterium]|nr:sulfide/dihydroorotate dehydrogenase-like FAD/NAD-binding protein [Elusimicrobiota bacterium]
MQNHEKTTNAIVYAKSLSKDVKLFEITNPYIAQKGLPGQFVVIRHREEGERIPLTIADIDRTKGTITIIFQEVGKTTKDLGKLKEGDFLLDILGPLGVPTEIEKCGTVVCIGGGVGAAVIYPIAKALKSAENKVIAIIGARTKELVILENKFKEITDELYITTDDGSYGRKGFVSDELKRLINEGNKIDRIWAIGPVIMMKVISDLTKPYGIKTTVSLNPIMIDGTGMCGGCRVQIGTETKFACVDGPEFDGHAVDFDLLMKRLSTYTHECSLMEQGRIYPTRIKAGLINQTPTKTMISKSKDPLVTLH